MRWDIPLSEADRAFAKQYCNYPTLVISPCTSQRNRNFRNWPVENYVEIARYAQERYGYRILLSGGSSELEREYGEMISAQGGPNIINLIGKTTLKQSVAIFAAADLLLSPDSGPAHMATAAGTPVLGIYATSNPDRTGPYVSRRLTVNRYPDALLKCMGKRVEEVRWGQRVRSAEAMELVLVSDVTDKIDDFFTK